MGIVANENLFAFVMVFVLMVALVESLLATCFVVYVLIG